MQIKFLYSYYKKLFHNYFCTNIIGRFEIILKFFNFEKSYFNASLFIISILF